MKIRSELYLVHRDERFFMPSVCYSLFGKEKKNFYGWFKIVKFPDAYTSNVSWCVGNNDGNISDMKSHDTHLMMQCLLPVVMRGYLGGDVQTALIELGVFFREQCYRKLKINLLEKLEKNIVLILCKLEKKFYYHFLMLWYIWLSIFQRKLFWPNRYIIDRCILLKGKEVIHILSYQL